MILTWKQLRDDFWGLLREHKFGMVRRVWVVAVWNLADFIGDVVNDWADWAEDRMMDFENE